MREQNTSNLARNKKQDAATLFHSLAPRPYSHSLLSPEPLCVDKYLFMHQLTKYALVRLGTSQGISVLHSGKGVWYFLGKDGYLCGSDIVLLPRQALRFPIMTEEHAGIQLLSNWLNTTRTHPSRTIIPSL